MNKRSLFLLLLFCALYWALPALADIGASDPSRLGVGARPLGMGRMFIPVADDASAVFLNPAGLTKPTQLQFMTMASRVVWAVDYRVLSLGIPLGANGALGLGYALREVPDIGLIGSAASTNGRFDRNQLVQGEYSDSAFLLGWAKRFDIGMFKRLSLGGTLKFFRKSGTGADSMELAKASGTNFDLGALWNMRNDINVGLTIQNLLHPADKSGMGVLTWDTGETEYFDTIVKTGISNRFFDRKVLLGIEYEGNTSQPQLPGVGHLGLEWNPVKPLYLRAGIAQTTAMADVNASSGYDMLNNLTLGIGLNMSGWRIDYAYHVVSDVPNLNSHFISMSLVGEEETPVEEAQPVAVAEPVELEVAVTSDILIVYTPEDQTVTYAPTILVTGKVNDRKTVRINGEDQPVAPNGTFSALSRLGIGRNDVVVSVADHPIKILRRVLRLASFIDVTVAPYKEPIEYLATLGFMDEDSDGYFKPDRYVTRAEVAKMMLKMRNIALPITMRGIWEDIDIAASQGLIIGFPDGRLRPSERLTKAQLAMIIARFEGVSAGPVRAVMSRSYLAQEHWAARAVQALANAGTFKAAEFSPLSGPVTRQELAMAFYRTSYIQKRVSDMLNFVDEVAEPVVPQKANIFMRTGQDSSEGAEKQAFESIMGGGAGTAGAASAAVPVGVAAAGTDLALYQSIVTDRAVSAVSSGKVQTSLLSIKRPYDQSIVYDQQVVVQGMVQAGTQVFVNETAVAVKPNGGFQTVVTLPKYGKHVVTIKAVNASGGVTRKMARLTYMPDIKDLPAQSPYKKTLSGLVALGYITLDNGSFNFSKSLTRAQWAMMLAKAKGAEPVAATFSDVPAGNAYAGSIGAVVKAGYLPPVKEGSFDPSGDVSRARAGMSLVRMMGLDTKTYEGKSGFTDVAASESYAKDLAALKDAGVLSGNSFKPMNSLTRLGGALFIANVPEVKKQLENLFDSVKK